MKKYIGIADIVSTRAWRDDDYFDNEEMRFGWRLEHLWINEDGKYTVCDEDGNHEPFDGRGARAFIKRADESWKNYAQWCLQNDCDPLHNFWAAETLKVEKAWTVKYRNWIGAQKHGLAAVSFSNSKKKYLPENVPAEVKKYFTLKKFGRVWCISSINSVDEMIAASKLDRHSGRKPKLGKGSVTALIDFVIPNPHYKSELRAAINRSLQLKNILS